MKSGNWKEIESALHGRRIGRAPSGAEVFWSAFRLRSGRVVRDAAAARPKAPAFQAAWWAPRVALATAALLVIVAGVGVFWKRAETSTVNRIQSLEVLAPYGAVIIMNDKDNAGTILWVADMGQNNARG